jgi:hypothetical protein
MVRLTGYITVGGRREFLNWTINGSEIVEGAGLSASEIKVIDPLVVVAPAPAAPAPQPVIDEAPVNEVVEPTSYGELNKTELQVLCSRAGLSASGTKAELIERLNTNDGAGEEAEVNEGENNATSDSE